MDEKKNDFPRKISSDTHGKVMNAHRGRKRVPYLGDDLPFSTSCGFFPYEKIYIHSPQIYDDVALNLTTVDFGGGTHNIYGQKKLDVGLFATLKIGVSYLFDLVLQLFQFQLELFR